MSFVVYHQQGINKDAQHPELQWRLFLSSNQRVNNSSSTIVNSNCSITISCNTDVFSLANYTTSVMILQVHNCRSITDNCCWLLPAIHRIPRRITNWWINLNYFSTIISICSDLISELFLCLHRDPFIDLHIPNVLWCGTFQGSFSNECDLMLPFNCN